MQKIDSNLDRTTKYKNIYIPTYHEKMIYYYFYALLGHAGWAQALDIGESLDFNDFMTLWFYDFMVL